MTFDTAASPWSRLWQTGVLHSCATGIQGNYDGAILAFWQRQFDARRGRSRMTRPAAWLAADSKSSALQPVLPMCG